MSGPLSGSRAWLVQRASAVYLLGFLVFVLVGLTVSQESWTYDSWRGWLLSPAMRVAMLLFFAALFLHAWIGLRDVILDYVKPIGIRSTLLALVAVAEAALAAWVLVIVLA
jgi:succinate dehydrogenase / fumarate reductase membrane anchor subunit